MKWIHLSDIHYNPKSDSSRTMRARKNLIPFLEGNDIVADHMFITGDYRHARKQNNHSEKDAAKKAVNYIVEVATAARVPLKNIHIVPGNHDLKRFDKTIESDKLEKMEAIRKKYIEEPDVFSDKDLEFLNEPFSFFNEVCKELMEQDSEFTNPLYNNETMPCAVGECFEDFSLLSLNTCLFCHTNSARKGELVIDTATVARQLQEIVMNNDRKPIIILAHHGMNCLETNTRQELELILSEITSPILYLCGDAHEMWIHRINDTLEITVGCLLESGQAQTMISMGKCSNNMLNSVCGYRCDHGTWGTYPQFDEEAKKQIQAVTKLTVTNNQERLLPSTTTIKNPKLPMVVKDKGKNWETYYEAWMQPYGLLVTDITGVLFDTKADGREEFPDEIVNTLANLAKRHISICFTTGRGRTGARHLLLNLAQKIVEMDPTLSWAALSGEWACITHNGAYLLTTPDKSRSGFLANAEPLCPEKHEYIEFHVNQNKLYELYKSEIKKICKQKNIDASKIISDISIEPVSVRFSLEHCPKDICNLIFHATENLCQKHLQKNTNYNWYSTTGRYEQKEMFEYSLVNKSDAVKDYIDRYQSIDPKNIIRVADTGQSGGSDYSFLTDGPSFSVGAIAEEKENTCFPVINWETNEVLSGSQATVYLLERLRFYPSLCVKSVADINQYKFAFANAISGARKRSEEIFSFYNTRLAWMDFLYEDNFSESNTARIFDIKSGAVTFSDYEWAIIERSIHEENDTLSVFEQICCFSKIINSKVSKTNQNEDKPRLTYFLHTDTHVLFRGYLYYMFLFKSINHSEGTDAITVGQWVEIYQEWFNDAKIFVELLKDALRDLVKSTFIPIGYLARKLIIGGLDNIRNILLILDYFYLRQSTIRQNRVEKDFFIQFEDGSDVLLNQCDEISVLLSDCLSAMYTGLFESQIDINFVDELNKWLDKLVLFMKKRDRDYAYLSDEKIEPTLRLYPNRDVPLNSIDSFFTETFPRWRESDCFIENVAALEIYLSKISDNETNLVFWGIPYGSLEHPILAKLLCEKHGLKASSKPHYIILHGQYESRHDNEFKLSVSKSSDFPTTYTDTNINVLIDDTLTTATTLDLGVKCLSLHGIALNDIVVMRYAGLNRLNHYLTNLITLETPTLNASAPDVTKLFNVISGLVAEAPYSKLHKYESSNSKPYEDTLGVFDKSRNRIKNYLIKNY